MTNEQLIPKQDEFYLHRHGGLYVAVARALSTTDKSEQVLMAHAFPFESELWVRPLSEFTSDRFTHIERAQAYQIMAGDREAAKAAITASKKAVK